MCRSLNPPLSQSLDLVLLSPPFKSPEDLESIQEQGSAPPQCQTLLFVLGAEGGSRWFGWWIRLRRDILVLALVLVLPPPDPGPDPPPAPLMWVCREQEVKLLELNETRGPGPSDSPRLFQTKVKLRENCSRLRENQKKTEIRESH